jgi:hypothetical protein
MKEAYRQKQVILKQLRYDLKLYQCQKDVQMVLRLKVIIAYENGMPENKIHIYLDVSKKVPSDGLKII